MVDSKVIGVRKISMVDGDSNTNKEPDRHANTTHFGLLYVLL